MYAETPRTLVLVGELDTKEMASLASYCRRLAASGQRELHLDLTGVTDCRTSGLVGLLGLLAEPAAPEITVGGARRSQFRRMLGQAPAADVPRLREAVGRLLAAGSGRGRGAGRAIPPVGREVCRTGEMRRGA